MMKAASVSKLGGRALADLSTLIAPSLEGTPPLGYVRGKTLMRDVLVRVLDCSEVEAELLVDQLEARGLIRFDTPPAASTMTQGVWRVVPSYPTTQEPT
jgi:hypothetical protein